MFWDPALTPSSFHGVTSVVAGNCGFSIAPCRPEHRALLARTLQHVEDMNLATLEAGIPWDFETFPEYLDSVARHGVGLNYGVYVGHTAVRLFVMGEEGYEREQPTDDEIAAMQAVVRDAMSAGAMGFATSSSATHNGDGGRPVPSRLADRAELEALLAAAARPRQGRRRVAAGRADQARGRPRDPAAARSPAHVDRAAHDQGLPVARGHHPRTTTRPGPKAARSGRRCRSARSCSR